MAEDDRRSRLADEVTLALNRFAAGDLEAANRVWSFFQDDIRRLAERFVWQFPSVQDLQATMLMNEVWIRLLGRTMEEDLVSDQLDPAESVEPPAKVWANRRHFWGAIALAMERFLIEQARAAKALKRGGGWRRIPLEVAVGELNDLAIAREADIEALRSALARLERLDPVAAEVARHRYLVGLTVQQTAMCLSLSPRTVDNKWKIARTRLRQYLDEGDGDVQYGAVAI